MQYQWLLHFLAQGECSDEIVLAKVRGLILSQIERHGRIEAWTFMTYAFRSMARIQVAGRKSVAYRLSLRESWASDEKRGKKAGGPDAI